MNSILKMLIKSFALPFITSLAKDLYIVIKAFLAKRKGKGKTDAINKAKAEKNEGNFDSGSDSL